MYYLFKDVDIEKILSIIKNINSVYVIVFIFTVWPLTLLFSAYRLKILLKEYNLNETFLNLIAISQINLFFSNFLPMGLAGDSYKYVYYKKKFGNEKINTLISILIVDKLSAILGLMASLTIFSSFFIFNMFGWTSLLTIGLLIITCFLIFFLLFKLNIDIMKTIPKVQSVKEILNAIKQHSISFWASMLMWGLLLGLVNAYGLFIFFKAFNFNMSFLYLLQTAPLLVLPDILPFTINGLGVRENLSVYLFSFQNCEDEVVIPLTLLARFVVLVLTSIGGIIYLLPNFNFRK